MLPDIINYIPDPKNGRPIANGRVYFLIENYDAPANALDIDTSKLAQVFYRENGNTIYVPQPIYTTQGGVLDIGCLADMPLIEVSASVRKAAVYDKCGKLVYQVAYSSTGCCIQIGGDLGLITNQPTDFVDFADVEDTATCFQDLGFLPSVIALKLDTFSITAALAVGGVINLPFTYSTGELDVYLNGSLITEYAETDADTITIDASVMLLTAPDNIFKINRRYVQLN